MGVRDRALELCPAEVFVVDQGGEGGYINCGNLCLR